MSVIILVTDIFNELSIRVQRKRPKFKVLAAYAGCLAIFLSCAFIPIVNIVMLAILIVGYRSIVDSIIDNIAGREE